MIAVIVAIWLGTIAAIYVVNHLVHRSQPPTPRPPVDDRTDAWFVTEFDALAREAHARAKREAQARRVHPTSRPEAS